jgi:hypothetical protein
MLPKLKMRVAPKVEPTALSPPRLTGLRCGTGCVPTLPRQLGRETGGSHNAEQPR